jgi:DnaJ-class molecular chaperone
MTDVSLVSLKVFCSYSHNDESLKDELAKHLTMLERLGVISTWHDRKIPPGKEWDQQINQNLNTADIILLLVSSDFIYSKYCWDVEVTTAIKRHEAGEACVIPIILRNVSWQSAPFAKLQSLPKNAQPVTSWTSKDDAFTNVAQGIQIAAEQLIRERQQKKVINECAIAEYLHQVEEFAVDGEISHVESEILKDLQEKLKLTDQESSAVREKVLEPYGRYKKNIDKYRQVLAKFVDDQGYPLGETAKAELKKFQQHYLLKDEDVVRLEEEQEQVEYQKRQAEKLLQQQESEKLRRQEQEKAEYENKLYRYEQELSRAVKVYPLDEFVLNGLKSFQQFLGLRDEDIASIEQTVLIPKQAEYERQQQESERLHQEQAKKSEIPILLDKVRGDDLRLDLKLELREAVFGGEKEIRISHLENCEMCNGSGTKPRTHPRICSTCSGSSQVSKITRTPFGSFTQVKNCPTCNGTGTVGEYKRGIVIEEKCDVCEGKGTNQVIKKLLITIPAGVDNGTRLRISQEGDAGLRGGSPGDLYVYLFVNEDEEFERDGINILSEIRIGYQQALSGCRLEVNTIDGLVELIIPPKTQPNTIMKLENRGVPRLGNPVSRGDHLMTVLVEI